MTRELLSCTLRGAASTRALGAALGRCLSPGDVLALVGPLGAGKTTLVQGFAAARGLPPTIPVQSPTFTICNELPTDPPLLHVDLYRLSSLSEAEDIGLDDRLCDGRTLAVVEWAELLPALLPGTALWLRLEHGGDTRRVVVGERDGGPLDWLVDATGDLEWIATNEPAPWEASSSP